MQDIDNLNIKDIMELCKNITKEKKVVYNMAYKHTATSDGVYDQLKEQILHLELPPGAAISEIETAEKYNVVMALEDHSALCKNSSEQIFYIEKVNSPYLRANADIGNYCVCSGRSCVYGSTAKCYGRSRRKGYRYMGA